MGLKRTANTLRPVMCTNKQKKRRIIERKEYVCFMTDSAQWMLNSPRIDGSFARANQMYIYGRQDKLGWLYVDMLHPTYIDAMEG